MKLSDLINKLQGTIQSFGDGEIHGVQGQSPLLFCFVRRMEGDESIATSIHLSQYAEGIIYYDSGVDVMSLADIKRKGQE